MCVDLNVLFENEFLAVCEKPVGVCAQHADGMTDLPALLARIPECRTLVTTGQKATDVIVETFACPEPPVGGSVEIGTLRFWRMPSTSRAYPLALERKADFYRRLWASE